MKKQDQSETAKSLISDLIDDKVELKKTIDDAKKEKPTEPEVSYIVYYVGENPDTVWEFFHNRNAEIITDINGNETCKSKPYGRLYGFWETNDKGSRSFKEHKSNNIKLMDFDTFLDKVPPNKDCIKIYDSEAEFFVDLL